MWPWGHAAVGYLCYALWTHGRHRRSPAAVPALAVVLGTLIPDLVDKPLAWSFDVLPLGRTLGHSLVAIVPVVATLWWLVDDRHHPAVAALGVGWVSHLFGDGVGAVSDPAVLGYALWPLTTPPPAETEQSFLAHVAGIELTPFFLAQSVLVVAALAVWRRDGYPGLGVVVDRISASLPAAVRS